MPSVCEDPDRHVLPEAEEAGLVRLESGRVALRHPLMPSAVYGSASFAARRVVHHLALAQVPSGDPDRRAWHMAAAKLVPDEAIAATLEETAGRPRRRGGGTGWPQRPWNGLRS